MDLNKLFKEADELLGVEKLNDKDEWEKGRRVPISLKCLIWVLRGLLYMIPLIVCVGMCIGLFYILINLPNEPGIEIVILPIAILFVAIPMGTFLYYKQTS